MSKAIDVAKGTTFGCLTVLEEVKSVNSKKRRFLCRCECGNEKVIMLSNLRNGHTKTCGRCNVKPIAIGDKFGKWEVVGDSRKSSKSYHKEWLCRCMCENHTIAYVDEQNLKRGLSKSCGCETLKKFEERSRKHGDTNTRLYCIWINIKQRCENPKNGSYRNYGGRGIKICDEWREYVCFKEWAINNGYDDSLTIDRINVNGNYEPLNCRWVTQKEQANNRRSNIKIEYDGKIHTATQWGSILNIDDKTIRFWYHKGLTLEEIIKKKGAIAK